MSVPMSSDGNTELKKTNLLTWMLPMLDLWTQDSTFKLIWITHSSFNAQFCWRWLTLCLIAMWLISFLQLERCVETADTLSKFHHFECDLIWFIWLSTWLNKESGGITRKVQDRMFSSVATSWPRQGKKYEKSESGLVASIFLRGSSWVATLQPHLCSWISKPKCDMWV